MTTTDDGKGEGFIERFRQRFKPEGFGLLSLTVSHARGATIFTEEQIEGFLTSELLRLADEVEAIDIHPTISKVLGVQIGAKDIKDKAASLIRRRAGGGEE